jgi:hypothetical protein
MLFFGTLRHQRISAAQNHRHYQRQSLDHEFLQNALNGGDSKAGDACGIVVLTGKKTNPADTALSPNAYLIRR